MEIRVGTCGWSYDDWKGSFYPEGTKDELEYYATQFSAVEIDSTWYRIPARKTVESWHRRSPEGFIFCPKLPGEITHERLLEDVAQPTEAFLRTIAGLDDRLGPIVVQLSPKFPAENMDRLELFLRSLSGDFRYAVEFRHKSWLEEERAPELLRELGIGVVMADHAYYPKITTATCDFAYVRLLGRHGVHPDASKVRRQRNHDLAGWVHVLGTLPGWVERSYVFVNNQFEGHSPDTVRRLVDILGRDVVSAPGRSSDEPPTLFD